MGILRSRPVMALLAVATLAGVVTTLLIGEGPGRAETPDRDDHRAAPATPTTEVLTTPPATAPPTTSPAPVTTTTAAPLPAGVIVGPWRHAAPGVDVSVFQPAAGG